MTPDINPGDVIYLARDYTARPLDPGVAFEVPLRAGERLVVAAVASGPPYGLLHVRRTPCGGPLLWMPWASIITGDLWRLAA